MTDKETEDRVLNFIINAIEPVHSTEIAKQLGINRVTATKYLSVLNSRGLISFRNVGMAKVWMHVENPILLAFEKNDENDTTIQTLDSLPDGVCVLDKHLGVVWINKEMEKRHGKNKDLKGRKCYKVFHQEEEICKNCPAKATFETGKRQFTSIRKKGFDIDISTSPLKGAKGKTLAVIEIVRLTKRK